MSALDFRSAEWGIFHYARIIFPEMTHFDRLWHLGSPIEVVETTSIYRGQSNVYNGGEVSDMVTSRAHIRDAVNVVFLATFAVAAIFSHLVL